MVVDLGPCGARRRVRRVLGRASASSLMPAAPVVVERMWGRLTRVQVGLFTEDVGWVKQTGCTGGASVAETRRAKPHIAESRRSGSGRQPDQVFFGVSGPRRRPAVASKTPAGLAAARCCSGRSSDEEVFSM